MLFYYRAAQNARQHFPADRILLSEAGPLPKTNPEFLLQDSLAQCVAQAPALLQHLRARPAERCHRLPHLGADPPEQARLYSDATIPSRTRAPPPCEQESAYGLPLSPCIPLRTSAM